ncbi:unnamed protein product [Paramecium pentaurelia]|uniref:EML-like second beta-propeller domain-containing protein n=1 Tax=Paramecium pentaurelia TaxID=43138 RepID=A0A8S1WE47_9CILI|nr:unnamed protein product [Paramecium pentaurelia]
MQGPFEDKEALADIFTQVKDVDEQIFDVILKIFSKEKVQDCIGYFSDIENHRHLEQSIFQQQEYLKLVDEQQKLHDVRNKINKITNVLKKLKDHQFNNKDFSTEENYKSTLDLINRIKDERQTIQFLKFLVHLTTIVEQFIQCGSNSLCLLVEMKVDLTKKNFENIKIKNTQLIGANFSRCNLNGSHFENVDISGMNLNGAQLFYCKWKNIKINELIFFDCQGEVSNLYVSLLIAVRQHYVVRTRYKNRKRNIQVRQSQGFCISACFSPDGKTLASCSKDKSILLWDLQAGQQVLKFYKMKLEGHRDCICTVSFSPKGDEIASGSNDKKIILCDSKTGQPIRKLVGHNGIVLAICFSPSGSILASGSRDNSICLWNTQTGQQQSQLYCNGGYIQSLCFSPDGTTLASGSSYSILCVWTVKTGKEIFQKDCQIGIIFSIQFSPDGTTLGSGSEDNSVHLWNSKTSEQKLKLLGHSNYVRTVSFSPDSTTLASGSDDYSIRLWNLKTGQEKSKLDGHHDCVLSVCFSHDGKKLASSGIDVSICIWDVQEKFTLDSLQDNMPLACISPDGNTLASGSYDNSIRLWEVKTGQQKAQLDGHTHYVIWEIKNKNLGQKYKISFFNTLCNTSNIMVYPDFNFSSFKRVVYKKPFPFRRIIGVNYNFLPQNLINLKTNINQPLIQIYFNILLVSNIC